MFASPEKSGITRGATLRAALGLIATGLLMGAASTVLLRGANELVAPGDAWVADAKSETKPQAKPAVVQPVRMTGAAGTVAPVKLGAAAPAKRALSGVQHTANIDDQVTYQYNALGRRDPFTPLVGGEFVGDDMGGDAPVDVGGMKVVGIVWGTSDKFALVEDGRGNSLVLRAGDKVMNGVVEGLKRDAVVVKLTVDGQTQSVAIPLTRKGEQFNANR